MVAQEYTPNTTPYANYLLKQIKNDTIILIYSSYAYQVRINCNRVSHAPLALKP